MCIRQMRRLSAGLNGSETMPHLDSIAVSPGDITSAVGSLTRTSSGHLLTAHLEGRYLKLSGELGGETAHVEGLIEPPLGEVVTVRGIWTGFEIVEARVSEGEVGVEPPRPIDPRAFSEVSGTATRSDILRAEVLDMCDALRGRSLVSFVAVPGPRGWFGLASAVDTEDVLVHLGPLLSPHLLVTASEWTLEQLQQVESLISDDENVRNFGTYWDTSGRYRAECLLHHLTPELAASLDAFPAGIAHVHVWLRPAA
jgi:hypothetical protein